MEEFETVISIVNPYVAVLSGLVFFMFSIYLGKRARAIRFAKWLIKEGKFEPLEEGVLEEAIRDAENSNVKDVFLAYLTRVRAEVGHTNLKLGHLFWIWDQISKNIPVEDQISIPTFIKDN